MRFFRRVRRVSASSLGSSAGISHSFLRRPPRPLPFDFASATLASSSSSAAFALLIGILAFFASSTLAALPVSGFAGSALASTGLPAALWAEAGSLARRCFLAATLATGRATRLLFRRLTALAFFLAARTFLTLDFRFRPIFPPPLATSRENRRL